MGAVIVCPACGQKYSAGPELAGKKIRCRGCGGGIRVPEPSPSPSQPAAATAPRPLKSPPPKPAPPKPAAPPPRDDDRDAYGLAEEPEAATAGEADDGPASEASRRPAMARRKKGRKRRGIGGLIESAREKPVAAGAIGAVLLGMALFLALKPAWAAPLYFLLGLLALVLGGLATAIRIFAQAPGMALAMIAALIVTFGAVAMLGGVGGGRSSRTWPMAVVGAAWGALLLRGKQRDISLDGESFRIPRRLMGGGAALAIASLVLMGLFPPAGVGARRAPRPARPPGGSLTRRVINPALPPSLPFDINSPPDAGPAPLPDLPAGRRLEPGVMRHEVTFGPTWMPGSPPGHSGILWVYLPEGDAPARSLPCIVIAAAGSPMIAGMNLGEGDRPEHIPWVKAGFAVAAYEIDGAAPVELNENTPMLLIRPSIEGFLKARAGVVNAQHALDYIAARLPQVDPSRIVAVGHSSAGALALLAAQNDARFRGVVAFAPGQYDDGAAIRGLEGTVPGISQLPTTFNPATSANLGRLNVPVFLFTAEDDGNVPAAKTRELAAALQSQGKRVTLDVVPSGGHYDAMINPGIPKAIAWARALPAGNGP